MKKIWSLGLVAFSLAAVASFANSAVAGLPEVSLAPSLGETVEVVVQNDIPPTAMVRKFYDSYNYSAAERFPLTQSGTGQTKLKMAVAKYTHSVSASQVTADLTNSKMRPATPQELLAFGAQHAKLLVSGCIFAVGGTWKEPDGHVYMAGVRNGRSVVTGWYDQATPWDNTDYKFLVVLK